MAGSRSCRADCAARRRSMLRVEALEGRIVPAGFSLAPDITTVMLPADATAFPACDVDVLANDSGTNLRIVSLGQPALGTVERLVGAGPGQRDLIRYVPGPTFRGRDSFVYSAIDDDRREASQQVIVGFEQDPLPFGPWRVAVPAALETRSADPLRFVGDDGTALVAVDYRGEATAGGVGVLLRWQPGERPGSFTAGTAADATFYPQSGGAAWIVGSIDGVNALLGSLAYVPAPGFSAPDGVRLTVQTHLYSPLSVGVGVELADILVRVIPAAEAPRAVDDAFRVRDTAEATFLDVLANDEAVVPGPLELVSAVIEGHSESEVSIDPGSGTIRYLPQRVFLGFETLFYTVRDAAGHTAQGRAVVTVMPEIMAVVRADVRGTGIVVVNASTEATIAEFLPFPERPVADVALAVADLDGDGMTEIFAMESGGGQRMRAFTPRGGMVDEAVVRPFANRQAGRIDMVAGDLDDDGRAEMVFAARTARGVEIRAVDAATKATEMSAVLRGMTGNPEVSLDEATGTLSILARSPSGAVMLATMDTAAGTPATRRVVVSDREVRALVRRNGPIVGMALASADGDGDGTTEALVGMTFRSGLVRVLEVEGAETARVAREDRVPTGTTVDLFAAAVEAARDASVVWWGSWGVGMADSGAEPRLRGRIRGVAIG